MNDGTYYYTKTGVELEIYIYDYGNSALMTLTYLKTKEKIICNLEYRKANNFEWYECTTEQASNCNWSFDLPQNSTIKLGNSDNNELITLKEKIVKWNGIYKNSEGTTLIISSFVKGTGFYYHLIHEGDGSCYGIDYTGYAKLTYPSIASKNEDFFTKKDNILIFEPSSSNVGMECQKYFDTKFY